MLPNKNAAGRWWLAPADPAKVRGFVNGVFEGGGVKGILYVGALDGVLKRGLWFSAVAGSSAGAITAAMIAAGLRPEEMRDEMTNGLKAMALPAIWNGFRRLRKATGFLDQDALRAWLRDVLRAQALRLGAALTEGGPSFKELFDLTGIELHVVAVDLSARRVMVFNQTLTPHADVADSVTASATIPIAFEPLVFRTEYPQETNRMIADGGIASNFPSFVFRDEGFRAFAGLDPMPDTMPVIGFLLDEAPGAGDDLRKAYQSGQFAGTVHDVVREREGDSFWTKVPKFRSRSPANLMRGAAVRSVWRGLDWLLFLAELALLKPALWLGKAFQHPVFWNWPAPTNRHIRVWTDVILSWIATAPGPLLVGVAAFAVIFWIGFVAVARSLYSGLISYAYQISNFFAAISFVFLLLLSVGALVLAVLMFLLSIGCLALLRVGYPSLGLLGRPLIQTFLQTPAPLPWAGYGKNETVVRLRVPRELTTWGAGPGVVLTQALQEAENVAYTTLGEMRMTSPPPS